MKVAAALQDRDGDSVAVVFLLARNLVGRQSPQI